jgi:putative Mn2+ efflux pump MntP
MKPGSLGLAVIVGFVVLWVPFVNMVAVFGFLTLIITALGLGVGDTWADWRRRARSTLS